MSDRGYLDRKRQETRKAQIETQKVNPKKRRGGKRERQFCVL